MPRPTLEQIKFFADNDLLLPPSRDVAQNLIRYVVFGNTLYKTPGQEEETPQQRAAYLREAQQKWIGKRVIRYANNGEGGVVEIEVFIYYLSARTRAEIRSALARQTNIQKAGLPAKMPDRFKAIINLMGRSVGLEWLKNPE